MKRALFICVIISIICSCFCNRTKQTDATNEEKKEKADSLSWPSDSLVIIDTAYYGLRFYYPITATVSWEFGQEPDTLRELLCFACAAAYTGKTVYQNKPRGIVKHTDVAGRHIEGGIVYEGYPCENNTGGFVSYGYGVREDGVMWDILDREAYLQACSQSPLPHSAFGQELLIYKGERKPFVRKDRPELYRALCRKNNRLCVVDGTHPHLLKSFVDLLLNAGVTDALYLDMGDWKYSWMRLHEFDHEHSEAIIIYDKPIGRPYYGTNWITFQYVN